MAASSRPTVPVDPANVGKRRDLAGHHEIGEGRLPQRIPAVQPNRREWVKVPLCGRSLCHQDPGAEDRKRTFGSRRLTTSRPKYIGSTAAGAAIPIIAGTCFIKRLSLSLVKALS